ncbi:hypothetical protein PRZ48_003397 [Zasmidium cellare]|uniref:Uncharacterized protein n=1 Tax=Zasmidium cellare TaxID=395010 RepID=A0ABR0EUY4_ZASCE|nr:hypothetical protein PRZ48_003397 [Zasmidium cellare]
MKRAEQDWDPDFFDFDKAKVMKRAEQAQQAQQAQQGRQGQQWFGWPGQFGQFGQFGINAGINFNNRFLFQQNPWLWQNQLLGRRRWGWW